jgi:hypothetical protein
MTDSLKFIIGKKTDITKKAGENIYLGARTVESVAVVDPCAVAYATRRSWTTNPKVQVVQYNQGSRVYPQMLEALQTSHDGSPHSS